MKEYNNLPLIALRGLTLFPNTILNVEIAREQSFKALQAALDEKSPVLFVTQKNNLTESPSKRDFERAGCIGIIKNVMKMPNNTARVAVAGIERAIIVNYVQTDPYMRVDAERIDAVNVDTLEAVALMREAKALFVEYFKLANNIPKEVFEMLNGIDKTEKYSDLMSDAIKHINKQTLLEEPDVEKRLELICKCLAYETDVMKVERKIKGRVQVAIDKNQKEYYLREQIKAIQDELGEGGAELDELKKKIEDIKAPDLVREKLLKEFIRMARLPSGSPEYGVVRNYLEWTVELPWKVETADNNNLVHAQKILDEDHYGLEKIKDRIIEYLAVRQLTDNLHGPILCLVGPPGVGKTSIAKSIARALDRKYIRISLGGVHDEAEIRGHRKTYIGAMAGRIMYNIKLAGSSNPVFLLDEIDKISSDYKGDPSSALLEVLDPEQNFSFRDNYLEVPFDLSKVLFIATANDAGAIPRPLWDRMEVIEMTGYTELEKLEIAKRHLISKQIKENGLSEGVLTIDDEALKLIINGYTKESGVRSLEREIARICRKTARKILEDKITEVKVTAKNLSEFLGVIRYNPSETMTDNEIGAATGLAWTAVGGDTLTIEVTLMKGKGEIQLTGYLGDVMKESARTAFSFIRSNAEKYGLDSDMFTNNDIHIHVPEGAIPKDGPSAGITIATAILSALSKRAVRSDIAMTGEVTLRGHVLGIGGLKEKSLAALRAGITTIIIPKENSKDISELPETLRKNIAYIPVSDVDSVFKSALV